MPKFVPCSSDLPRDDAGLSMWLANFARHAAAEPQGLNLERADIEQLIALSDAFDNLLQEAASPMTRTSSIIALKDKARADALSIFRPIINRIRTDPAISPVIKINLGMRVPRQASTKPRLPAPATSPMLHIVRAEDGKHILQYCDSMRPEVRSKPYGVIQLDLFVAIGDQANPMIADPAAEAAFAGAFTRTPLTVNFKPEADGKVATYYAHWAGRGGKVGPWSSPVWMVVCARKPAPLQSSAAVAELKLPPLTETQQIFQPGDTSNLTQLG